MRNASLLAAVFLSVGGACQSEDPFVADLRHASPERRAAAAEFLGAQREADAVAALVYALRDTVPAVRAKAVWALGMIRAKDTRRDLATMLADRDRRVRQAVAWSLMQLEEPEAIPMLEAALGVERDPWVRTELERAVEYLRRFEGEEDVHESSFR